MITATVILAALVRLIASDSTEPAPAHCEAGRNSDRPDRR